MKKLLLLPLLFISFISFSQVPNYVPTDSLVGYWPFNGNAVDESGNGHDGIINGPTLVVDENGIADQAYYFAGNDNITIPHHSDFNIQSLSIVITFQDFENPAAYPNGNSVLFSKREATGWGSGFEFNQGGSSWDFAASNSISGNTTYGFGAPQTYGQWRTIVYTHDADSIKVYFDGVLIDGLSSPGFYNSNSLDITFGMRGNGMHEYIGSISEIGLWNRVLDSCEVKDLYNASLGNCCAINPITSQPTDQTTTIGNNTTISFADNLTGATYQWQMDAGTGYSDLSNAGQFSGTDTQTLTISSTSMGNYNTLYRCVVTESASCSDTTDVSTLTVIDNPSPDCIGDLNGDGFVTLSDLTILLTVYGSVCD